MSLSTRSSRGSLSTRLSSIRDLFSSASKLAVFGLVGAFMTVGFMLWMQTSMKRQLTVSMPLARTCIELERDLVYSAAELRGWVAYKDPAARTRRAEIWRDQIEPALARIEAAASSPKIGLEVAKVGELRTQLRRLKYLQWAVEDIAHEPGNLNARALYEREAAPIGEQLLLRLLFAMTRHEADDASEDRTRLRYAELRGLVLEVDRAILQVSEENGALRAVAIDLASRLERQADNLGEIDPEGTLAPELRAYADRAKAIVARSVGEQANLSRALFREQLRPVNQRTQALLDEIVSGQQARVAKESKGLMRWSYVILALSLLVGVLSAMSLYLTYRREERIQRALANAKSLGKYEVEGPLGRGTSGQVFRAKHALLRRPAAVKVLRSRNALTPAAQARFFKEVQVTSTLDHPNTVAIYDYGKTRDGLLYYAMELVDGVTLQALVDISGPLPPGRVRAILLQVCGSLAEAHKAGLLHRDIKPSNIMVAEMGGRPDVVKVLDFGLVVEAADTEQRAHRGRSTVHPLFGQQLTEDDPERIHVAQRSDVLHFATELLGGHVTHRSEDRAARGLHCPARVLDRLRGFGEHLREPPVEQVHLAELAEHDVGGLHVAMHHAACVRVVHHMTDLHEAMQQLMLRERDLGFLAALVSFEHAIHAHAADALHREVEIALGIDPEVVDGNHRGVPELTLDARLAYESPFARGA